MVATAASTYAAWAGCGPRHRACWLLGAPDPAVARRPTLRRLRPLLKGLYKLIQTAVVGRVQGQLPAPGGGDHGWGQGGESAHEHMAAAARKPAQLVDLLRR